jgi:hypothetical protein
MNKIILALVIAFSSPILIAQNFPCEINYYDHSYRCTINTEKYAMWVLDQEKEWYLAPDSTSSQLLTPKEWTIERQKLKQSGFNELDSRYYWNPNTKTVALLYAERHKKTGLLELSINYGTNIR